MSNIALYPLLRDDDPPSAAIERPHSQSPFILLADHAGQRIPSQLGDLGLAQEKLTAILVGILAHWQRHGYLANIWMRP